MFKALSFLAYSFSVVAVLSVASPAKAGLLIEPYVGYKIGSYKTSTDELTLASPQVGARVGFSFPMVFIAADYSTLVSGKFSNGTNGLADGDASESQLFADLGVSLPLLRAYAGYGFMNKLDYKPSGADNTSENGTAFKVGIGTTLLPIVAINVEYVHSDYDKLNGVTTSGVSSNFYSINLSLPFNL